MLCNLSMSHSLLLTKAIIYRDDANELYGKKSRYWRESYCLPSHYVNVKIDGKFDVHDFVIGRPQPEFNTLTTIAILIL